MRHLALLLVLAVHAAGASAQVQQPYIHERTESGIPTPLDVGFDDQGRLLVAMGRAGLVRIEHDGSRTPIAPGRVDRVPMPGRPQADAARHVVRMPGAAEPVSGAAWPIGRLLSPEAAATAPDGSLWIADTGHARVVRVEPSGQATAFGERGFFPGQFIAPSGVAFDAGGPLITDRLNHRVTRLAWDGSLRDIFGLHAVWPREGEGRLHYPRAIAVDAASGRVAVAEPFERRVQVFRPAQPGEVVPRIPPLPSKSGVSSHFGPDVSVADPLVAAWEPESGCVVLWDTRVDPPAHVTTFGGAGDRPSLFLSPASVLCEPDGSAVWVLDALGDRLERWVLDRDPAGAIGFDPFMARLDRGVSLQVVRAESRLAQVAGSDLLWDRGRVGVAFADGSVAWTTPLLDRFERDARDARPRNDGEPLRSCTVAENGDLVMLWSNGIERRSARAATLLPLARIAADPRGVLAFEGGYAVSDADRDALLLLDAAGQPGPSIVPARPEPERFDGAAAARDGALWLPERMDRRTSDGSIWIVDYGNHRLQRFGADGTWQATFTLSRSRARDRSAPSAAPSNEQQQRTESRRQQALGLARGGAGSMPIAGGGRLDWKAAGPLPNGEPFALDVSATDAAGKPLEGVRLLADCTMPHHGHGMNVRPEVTTIGPGQWRVEPMLLHMPGRWELSFDLLAADGRLRRVQQTLEIE
jgi:hypothetical protein